MLGLNYCKWAFIISLVLLIVFYLGWKKFRKTFNSIPARIWKILKIVLIILKKLINKLKTWIKEKHEENPQLNLIEEAYTFVMIIFAITLLIYILIPVSTDLYKNNFDEEFRNYFSLGLVFVAFLIYIIFALIYRKLRPLHYIILPTIFYSILWFIENYKDYKTFAYVVFVIIIIVYPFILVKTWKGANWWIISAVFIGLLFLLLGFIGIDAQFGEKKMHLPLNTCTNTTRTHWELKCTNREDKIIVGYNVTCRIEPEMQNNKGMVIFQFHNGSYNMMDYSGFLLPNDVGWIRFEINGKDNQKDTCLSVSKTIRIPTYEEHKSDKDKFITYLLALFGFIFTSIPIILKNIKELMKND